MPAPDFEALVGGLVDELRPFAAVPGADWRRAAVTTIIPRRLDGAAAPEALLAWARDHKRYSLTLAECAGEVCAKPREAAIYLLCAIAAEHFEDEGQGGISG